MPHTSHKKQIVRKKRAKVTDEEGWTRVTTTDISQRQPQPLPAQRDLEARYTENDQRYTEYLNPSELPANKSLDQLEDQYRRLEKKWLDSSSCHALKKILEETVDKQVLEDVDKCVIFGTGTFCGQLRNGIERFEVSMYQLAAFASAVDVIEKLTGVRPAVFAQEPRYNSLDSDLLSRLQITTLTHPEGSRLLTTRSFVYCPNAEQLILLRCLVNNPAIALLNGKLDSFWRNEKGEACTNVSLRNVRTDVSDGSRIESVHRKALHELTDDEQGMFVQGEGPMDSIEEGLNICDGFKNDKDMLGLPPLDVKDQPFYDVHLFFRRALDDGNAGADETQDVEIPHS